MTMWLETMIDSAMDSRMIIEVADEKPPMKANSARPSWPAAIGRVSANMSGIGARRHRRSARYTAMGRMKRLISSM